MMKSESVLGKVIVAGLIAFVAALIFSHVPHAFAQSAGDAGGFVTCGNKADDPCQVGDLFDTFVVIINYLITMAGFVAVLAIVYSGFLMVTSQGEGQLTTAKGRLSGAVIGLVLVAAAFVLINSIFAGSFSLGVKNGAKILINPLEYIKGEPAANTATPGK